MTPENWEDAQVDANLDTFINGGTDTEGNYWPGTKNQTLSRQLGIQLYNMENWNCSIASPCTNEIVCDNLPRWGYFAMTAFGNLNMQFTMLFDAANDAGGDIGNLDASLADTFHTHIDPKSLNGLMLALTVITFIVGIIGLLLGAAGPEFLILATEFCVVGASVGLAKTAILMATDNHDPDKTAANYGRFIAGTLDFFRDKLENAAGDLFQGKTLGNSSYGIQDVMRGGKWTTPETFRQVDYIKAIRGDFISRGINAMWRLAPTTNTKMWVSFVDLRDISGDACKADVSGPQSTKYCADGGVYYLYRFDEDGDHTGYLSEPFGLSNFSDYGLDPSIIAESSAKSYRKSQNGFNFNATTDLTDNMIETTKGGMQHYIDKPGSFIGDWTIPVCDMGTHTSWNQDYYTNPPRHKSKRGGPLPCMCGPNGTQTADFVRAAKMVNFDTLIDWCQNNQLKDPAAWPPGVTQVDYGYKVIKKPKTH